MAKASYKIPASLNDNYLNMEIAIQNKEGVGLRPLPVRVILTWVAGLLGLFFFEANDMSILKHGTLLVRLIFAVTWIGLIYILSKVDKTHRMQLELIPACISYLQKSNKYVTTRRASNAGPFYSIVGIDDIDDQTGMITYADGTFGYWYAVVGTASVLLFPNDRDAILDRVNEFYKKIQPDCEIIFMTAKEPQKVYHQINHLTAQYNALTYKDPDIDKIVREQYDILKDFVGKEFKSLHQYMIIKGDNREALTNINNVVRGECEGSSLMLKQCIPLYKEDVIEVLKSIYQEGGNE